MQVLVIIYQCSPRRNKPVKYVFAISVHLRWRRIYNLWKENCCLRPYLCPVLLLFMSFSTSFYIIHSWWSKGIRLWLPYPSLDMSSFKLSIHSFIPRLSSGRCCQLQWMSEQATNTLYMLSYESSWNWKPYSQYSFFFSYMFSISLNKEPQNNLLSQVYSHPLSTMLSTHLKRNSSSLKYTM